MRIRAGWLLLAGYVAIAMPVVGICVLFVVNAQKHLGANYISFSTEVVRGQQDATRLRSAAQALMRHGGEDNARALREALTVIETRKTTVLHAMERTPFADMDLDDIHAEFRRLQADLARIATLGRGGTLQRSSVRSALRARVFAVEDDVAFIYSELHKRVVSASAAQQRLMERLSYALLSLVALVLVGLGALLKSSVRASDAVSRVGGEEFCILMPNTRVRESLVLCARVRDAIVGEPCPVGPDGTLPCTVSIGVATTQAGGRETFEALYARADAALYAAKRGGRDRIVHERDTPSEAGTAGEARRARE
ncbi:diguanylate cyclase [Arhodomonas sp. AD133]|uniref:diguanylate cyclase n=1 Tax=Arhodomonas sp. AD133 TaxID=3415009 RepID=UPI003EBF4750